MTTGVVDAGRDELLAAVETIRPTLEETADASELGRTLAEPAWRALHDTGLFRLKSPRVLGGHEADPVTQIEVFEAVTRIDTSAGWTLMVGAGTLAGVAARIPDEGLALWLVDGRLPRVAGGMIPSGRATAVDGGYRVTGRWQFGSGSGHAEWFTAATVVDDREPPVVFCNFPASDVTIHDTWYVGGLRGTGSHDFSVEDVFVPSALVNHVGPPRRGGLLYRLGSPGSLTNEHAGFALGAGARALDEARAVATLKSRGYRSASNVAARAMFQHDLGRSEQMLRAARALVVDTYRRAWAHVLAVGEACPPAMQIEMRVAATYATEVACRVSERMFRHLGARSLFSGNVVERCRRDVEAAAQHLMVSEEAYEAHGRALLGLDSAPLH